MKKTVLIALLTLFTLQLFSGQQAKMHGTVNLPRRFTVGDLYYSSTYKGIRLFMSDLQADDPQLYQVMRPGFDEIRKKRNATIATWSAGGAVGATLLVGSFTWWAQPEDIFKPGSPFYDPNATKPNIPVLVGGMSAIIVGGLVGLLVMPKESDIYRFVNTFNRNSPNRKMDWQIGLETPNFNAVGLKLTVNL